MNKIRVLVIDDNEELIDELVKYFKYDKEIEVVYIAYDGKEGIYYLEEKNNINLIILDLIMPNIDGIDVLEYINKNKINKKIIVITSYKDQNIIKKVSSLGASYFIIKPFDLSKLRKIILDIMKESQKNIFINLINKQVQTIIIKTLHELGVPSSIKGYIYLKEGIALAYKEPHIINEMNIQLYSKIANKYSSTPKRVERSIRHAIEISWNRGNWDLMEEIFGNSIDMDKAKPTNSEYIITIAERLRIEYNY